MCTCVATLWRRCLEHTLGYAGLGCVINHRRRLKPYNIQDHQRTYAMPSYTPGAHFFHKNVKLFYILDSGHGIVPNEEIFEMREVREIIGSCMMPRHCINDLVTCVFQRMA